jgi:hypothetical protein
MAIWQWTICMVPKPAIINQFGEVPQQINLDSFEEVNWWKELSEKELVNFFSSILPDYPQPWAQFCQSWGSDNEDRITLGIDKDVVEDIEVRVDLRDLNINLLRSLISYCQRNNFLFYTIDTGVFIEPDFDLLLQTILNSRKMGYIENPNKFIEDKEHFDKMSAEMRDKYVG